MPTALKSKRTTEKPTAQKCVDECVEQRLADCAYSFVFSKVTWQFETGQLILSGRVPSFYLKQVLQELLRSVEHVDRIVNNVDVISSTGLSSERRNGNGRTD